MSNKFDIKDHGVREEMSTGSRRDTQKGKPRYDLIPASVITKLAMHYGRGAEKYGDCNWQKGQPITRYMASAERHFQYFKMGLVDEPHLIACLWNLVAIDWTLDAIESGVLPEELDDRPADMREGYPANLNLAKMIECNVLNKNSNQPAVENIENILVDDHSRLGNDPISRLFSEGGMDLDDVFDVLAHDPRNINVEILHNEPGTDIFIMVFISSEHKKLIKQTAIASIFDEKSDLVYFTMGDEAEMIVLEKILDILDKQGIPFCLMSKGVYKRISSGKNSVVMAIDEEGGERILSSSKGKIKWETTHGKRVDSILKNAVVINSINELSSIMGDKKNSKLFDGIVNLTISAMGEK